MQAALDALDLEKVKGDWGSVDFSKLEMDWTEEPEYCRADFLKKGVGQKDQATGKWCGIGVMNTKGHTLAMDIRGYESDFVLCWDGKIVKVLVKGMKWED